MQARVSRPWKTPPVDTIGTSSSAMWFISEKMASRETEGSRDMGGTCSHRRRVSEKMASRETEGSREIGGTCSHRRRHSVGHIAAGLRSLCGRLAGCVLWVDACCENAIDLLWLVCDQISSL